jgi:hypothetical protein
MQIEIDAEGIVKEVGMEGVSVAHQEGFAHPPEVPEVLVAVGDEVAGNAVVKVRTVGQVTSTARAA